MSTTPYVDLDQVAAMGSGRRELAPSTMRSGPCMDGRRAQVIGLRFFGGLTVEETAQV